VTGFVLEGCAPLDRTLGNGCAEAGWLCPPGGLLDFREVLEVTKLATQAGGVLCCRNLTRGEPSGCQTKTLGVSNDGELLVNSANLGGGTVANASQTFFSLLMFRNIGQPLTDGAIEKVELVLTASSECPTCPAPGSFQVHRIDQPWVEKTDGAIPGTSGATGYGGNWIQSPFSPTFSGQLLGARTNQATSGESRRSWA